MTTENSLFRFEARYPARSNVVFCHTIYRDLEDEVQELEVEVEGLLTAGYGATSEYPADSGDFEFRSVTDAKTGEPIEISEEEEELLLSVAYESFND